MIIITGASRNIGKYLLEHFRATGEDVIGTFNKTIEREQESPCYYRVDISDSTAVKAWVDSLRNRLDRIVLINCAGISYNSFAHKAEIEKWQNVIKVNLLGTFNVIHELLPVMRSQNYGRIINFSSVVGELPTPGVSAYAASKTALWGLTKSLAVENAAKGVTINNINLGYTDMGMGVNDVPLEYQAQIKERIPLHRFCTPEEIVNTVKYIIDTEYLTGANIDLNGGLI